MASGFHWYPQVRRAISDAMQQALGDVAEDIVADAEESEVVPHAEDASRPGHEAGRLASSVSVDKSRSSDGTVRIVWDAPFAARAYFHPEWRFSQAVHGSARGRWMDDYMAGGPKAGLAAKSYARNLRKRKWFG